MHEDVLRGRRTEAPEILGPFLEQADAAGLESPTLRAVHRVVMTVDALLFGRSRSS
jgi:ketopantoate reductase